MVMIIDTIGELKDSKKSSLTPLVFSRRKPVDYSNVPQPGATLQTAMETRLTKFRKIMLTRTSLILLRSDSL